jgi:DNA-binding NarL/FixJ family response regulator
MSLIRVLAVDDYEVHLEGMRSRIKLEEDMEWAGEAKDGESAIALVQELSPDVMILDMNLGQKKMNGIEVVRSLRRDNKVLRILVLSAYDSPRYIFSVLDAGANGYLLKNESLNRIIEGIRGIYRGEKWWYSAEVMAKIETARRRGRRDGSLSSREQEIVPFFGYGLSDEIISRHLGITVDGIRSHRRNIYAKLNIKNKGEAAAWAWMHGYMDSIDIDLVCVSDNGGGK